MKEKINIIQFMPYFPPHKGGVETVGEELSKWWVKKEFGEVINVVFDVGQIKKDNYSSYGFKVILVPSFDMVSGFPVPKFWSKKFWKSFKEINFNNTDRRIILTHTRFFLSSFIGGVYSKINKLKWVHIEHGSDYVKLGSKIKSKVAFIYDKLIGKWIFKNADQVLAISSACSRFITNEFTKRDVGIWYRGVDIENIDLKNNLRNKFQGKIILGFVGRLVGWKNVDSLIKAYLQIKNKEKIQLVIVGGGEEFNNLKSLDKDSDVFFTGGVDFLTALSLQKEFDVHIHSSSPGGGLATTLIQAIYFGKRIVATPNEGADEVIKNGYNGILLKNDSVEEIYNGIQDILLNFEEYSKFENENKQLFEEMFKWEKNIEELYNKIYE